MWQLYLKLIVIRSVAIRRDYPDRYVHAMDRLLRSLKDLQAVVEDPTSRGMSVSFVKEGMTFTWKRRHHGDSDARASRRCRSI
ncbi:hypothetical protein VARIO8X_110124 [Burkholderiales bacterium 8X]|nr:hypothetical protein VARIO8X_110124 [Burkholderiales bacterium 8X]